MFTSRHERIKFEIFSIVSPILIVIITMIFGTIYHSSHPLITQTLINPEISKSIALGIFLLYAITFYFAILRKYDRIIKYNYRASSSDRLSRIKLYLPAWNALQYCIIAYLILGIIFLNPLDVGIVTISCEIIQILFRATA